MSATTFTPLRRSLAIQLRIIHALLLREVITRYGRHGLGVLWIFLEPMLFTLGVAALWTLVLQKSLSTNLPVIAFAITGYSSILMWRNVANRCAKAIEPNLALMYHRNVKVIDVLLSRIVLEWVGSTTSLTVLTLFFSSIGVIQLPYDLLLVIGGWGLLAWFSLDLGLIVGAISERSETFERVWHVLTYLMIPLSGAFFMVDWMPKPFQDAILWFPVIHGLEMMRHGYFGDIVRTYENVGFVIVANLVFTLVGLLLVRDLGRRLEPE